MGGRLLPGAGRNSPPGSLNVIIDHPAGPVRILNPHLHIEKNLSQHTKILAHSSSHTNNDSYIFLSTHNNNKTQ